MSKRTLIFAALAIVLFVVSLFSVVYDFKPVQEPEEDNNLFTDQDEPEPDDLIEDQQKKIFAVKMQAARAQKKADRDKLNIESNGTEQATN
jgi:hypothetical protein